MDKSEKTILLVFLLVITVACCLVVLCVGVGLAVFSGENFSFLEEIDKPPVVFATPTGSPTIVPATPTENSGFSSPDELERAFATLNILENTVAPSADLIYLAERYEGKKGIPVQLTSAPIPYKLGDRLEFTKMNTDTNIASQVTAVLRFASDSIYFWVEDGVSFDQKELLKMMETFEKKIYPTNQEFFGAEWIPGVDNDPHLYILYASDLGSSLAGYNSSSDTVLRLAHDSSNAHEMFYLNSDALPLSDPYTLSVMAHEFQHLIHGYHDPNEEIWMNEGFSELATLLNGFSAGGFDYVFAYDTDVQLNDWSTDSNENVSHYGSSFLFVTYLLDRFGEDMTKEIVANKLSGFTSIEDVFQQNNLLDPVSGRAITADDFFMDWVIANVINDANFADGRYVYNIYPEAPSASIGEVITNCRNSQFDRTVKQYGSDYFKLACDDGDDILFSFSGAATVPVLPVEDHANRFMWSNRSDASVTKLSREFDFTNLSAPVTLQYDTWYDIETDYDYLYLLATIDGENWRLIPSPACSSSDVSGNNYGCGYNGSSAGWISQEIDLSQFAGKKVTLSFEYVTDEAVTGEGFLIDNIKINAIDYNANFEADDGGWLAEGFARIDNAIPQTFLVSIIDPSGSQPLQKHIINAGEKLELELKALQSDLQYIIAISGSSRFTRQAAPYQIILR